MLGSIRSTMSGPARWTLKLLAPLVLGGTVLATPAYLLIPCLGNDELHWINTLPVRLALAAFMAAGGLVLSTLLSRAQEWVVLDGMFLVAKGLWARKPRRESLMNLKKIHANGCIEFQSGFKLLLEDHRSVEAREILSRLRWWEMYGMRFP